MWSKAREVKPSKPTSQEAMLRVEKRERRPLSPAKQPPDLCLETQRPGHTHTAQSTAGRGDGGSSPRCPDMWPCTVLLLKPQASLRDAVSCFHPKVKVEKSGREEALDAAVHVGVDKSISLKPGRQIRGGASGQSLPLIAAKDRWVAQVTPGSLPWVLRHKT